ncbi:MAG: hypothetical protein JWO38_252 [Gemmataceae bacterium]|nr:hypothetical protein [Gemmataceae bacterium]
MTMLADPEYRRLATESSNDMIRHDARRGEGEYEKAALHIREAGAGRLRMGRIAYDAGNFARAAADWLSAGACFYLATDGTRMRECIDRVRQLDQEGKIPADRRDIRAAIQEREGEVRTLEEKVTRFLQNYRGLAARFPQRNGERLEFLREQVRELPGFADLHFEIYRHARTLGQASLAGEHLNWATKFDPDNPEYVGRFGYQLIQLGQPAQAAELGREFLRTHSTEPTVRIMLAQALVSSTGGQTPDREGSLAVLQPVLEDPSIRANVRLAAIVLSAAVQHDAGHEVEYHQLLDDFDRVAATIQASDERTQVAELRRVISRPRTNGVTNGRQHFGETNLSSLLQSRLCEHLNPQTAGAVA